MRTTVEITEEQDRALTVLAHRRGVRGFSQLVQEAIDAYLSELGSDEVEWLLPLNGILSDDDEREVRSRIDGVRAVWPTP